MKFRTLALTFAFVSAIAGVVAAQPLDTTKKPVETTALANSSSDISVSGKVVSSTSTELVIDSDSGSRMTFALDPNTTPATSFTAGERVTVKYHSSSGGTVYQAASITVDPPTEIEREVDEVSTPFNERLPDTASVLPLIALVGFLAVGGAVAVRIARS
jgi:hypothetical protein